MQMLTVWGWQCQIQRSLLLEAQKQLRQVASTTKLQVLESVYGPGSQCASESLIFVDRGRLSLSGGIVIPSAPIPAVLFVGVTLAADGAR